MGDSNWNWGDNGGNQAWQQQQQSQQPSYGGQVPPQQRNPSVPSQPVDYYSQHAPAYGAPQGAGFGQAPPANDFFAAQPSQQHQHQTEYPNVPGHDFGQQQGSFGAQQMGAISQQIMSDPMLSAAKQFGGQFAEQQKEKFAKYLSAFQLKYYFAVDNAYVGKKLGILMFPFLHKDWTMKSDISNEPTPPRFDVNAPDLYIPLMAFTTFILISGFVLGVQGRFSPEQLGIITTNAMVYLIIENVIIMITKYVMNISHALSVWHSLAYSGYKYVGMNISLLAFLVGGKSFYYATLAYTSLATVFFLLRTVKNFVLDVQGMYNSHDEGKKRKLYLLAFISFTQPFVMWWLSSSVAAQMPGKMDFAQLALSGMGLNKAASNGQVPIMADGEVDYEALLKMP